MKRKKRRTDMEMRRDILYALQKDGGLMLKTHILQKANLSSQYLNKQLGVMLLDGVIKEIQHPSKRKRKAIAITQKGHEEAQTWRQISE